MSDKVQVSQIVHDQLLAIRDSGETNMLDLTRVRELAQEQGYTELDEWIEADKRQYVAAIMRGIEVKRGET